MISAPLELSDSTDRWQQLQLLRRGRTPVQPWLQQLEQAGSPASIEVLAALIGQLDRAGVDQLLSGPVGRDAATLLEAARLELPLLAGAAEVKQAWADFKGIKPGTPVLDQPATAEQRKQLLAAAKSRNAQVLERFDKDASTVIFIEGRDRVRVLLVALVYAAAFWAFLKRA